MGGLALSPDGTKLAIGIQPKPHTTNLTVLKLYSVPAGKVLRTWYANGTIGDSGEDPEALSWTSGQRMLAFYWEANGTPYQAGAWLLDLGNGAGTTSLNSGNSRCVPPYSSASPLSCDSDKVITPNGSDIVCWASDGSSDGFQEFSTTTGRAAQALAEWSTKSDQAEVLWSNPSGSVLIGTTPVGQVGMITAGTFTALPGSVDESSQDQGAW